MKSTNKSTHETNQLSDTIIIIIYLKKITIQVKSTIPLFLTRQTGQMVETMYR